MWRSFVARLLSKYQWFINPLVDKRDPLFLLMRDHGFKPAAFRIKKFINPFYDEARLVGIFITNYSDNIYHTQLQLCVYKKHEFYFTKDGKELYCLAHLFMHGGGDAAYRLGSHYKTDFVEFKDIPSFLKASSKMIETRAMVFRIQEGSRKIAVPQKETT